MLIGTKRVLLNNKSSILALDGITAGIKAAYSTRRLLTSYTVNKAIRVQRISDNTQQDIGFVSNVLDTVALGTFCSGTTGKVITWYDQSGGGFDQTQGTIANAPIIYQSGAVNTINSKPALLFVAATPTWLANGSLSASPVNTLFQNAVITTTGSTGAIVGSNATTTLEWRVDVTTLDLNLLNAGNASLGVSSSGLTANTGAIAEMSYNSSTGAGAFWVNRIAAGTFTSAFSPNANTVVVGRHISPSEPLDGSFGELIMYDLSGGIPSANRQSIENNQKIYWNTP